MTTMDFDAAVRYLYALSDVERGHSLPGTAPRFNLDRVRRLLALLGNPEQRFATVHIAGTKGKGSTAAMIDGITRAAGYHTGRFTSPHLHHFLERITIDGQPIGEDLFATLVAEVKPLVEQVEREHPELGTLTTFEVVTAVASEAFARAGVELAVLEAGMGGRLDATNIVTPVVSILTSISLDHTQFLGDTLLAIATEKAGIIKPGVPVVSAPQRQEVIDLFRATCHERRARLVEVGRDITWGGGSQFTVHGRRGDYRDLSLALAGEHQRENAALAIGAVEVLAEAGWPVAEKAVRTGLAGVWWPGRLETIGLRPLTLVDGAHNADSMRRLRLALQVHAGQKLVVVLGALADKDLSGMIGEIAPAADAIIVTQSHHPRSAHGDQIVGMIESHCPTVHQATDIASALRLARELAGADGIVCATGSLSVVAEAREAVGLISALDRYAAPRTPAPIPH